MDAFGRAAGVHALWRVRDSQGLTARLPPQNPNLELLLFILFPTFFFALFFVLYSLLYKLRDQPLQRLGICCKAEHACSMRALAFVYTVGLIMEYNPSSTDAAVKLA